MADRQRLESALVAADAAGDAEAAQMLAQEIRRMPPSSSAGGAPAPQADTERSLFDRGVDYASELPGKAVDLGRSVADAFQGPEGLPDVGEFDVSAPTLGQTAKAAAGLMATADPEAQRDIILANYPGAEIETVEANGQQYQIVNWTDPEGETHRGYINAPGMSFRDMTRTGAQIAAFTPAARTGRGLMTLGRMLRVAPASFATSLGLDATAIGTGSEQGFDFEKAGIEGLVGAGGELLSPAATALFRQMRGQSRYFNLRTGSLTKEGRRLAEEAGLGADDIADLGTAGQRTFAQYAEAGIDPEIGARAARVNEFDLPATRGQVGMSGQQLTAEERMRAGALGEVPQAQMRRFSETQQEAAEEAAGGIQQRLGGNATREAEGAERVLTGVRSAANRLRQRIGDAYQSVRDAGGVAILPDAAEELPERLAANLDDLDVHPDLTPATYRSTEIIGELADSIARGDSSKFEVYRRRLSSLRDTAKNRTDREGIRRSIKAFDEWADDAFDQGLFEGSAEALEMMKKARSLRTQYGKQFEPTKKTDSAGKIMQRIVEDAETPEDVVNYVFGQSALGRKQDSASALKRIRQSVGENSEAWDGIRETAWLRLTRNKQGDLLSARILKNNIKELNNRNKALYETLYSPDERRLINRFVEALDVTQPKPQNPSGTAASLENAIRYTLRRFGQRESFTKGNVTKGTMLNFMARMKLPLIGRGLGGSPATRAQNISPPAASSPAFVSTALGVSSAGDGTVLREDQ